MDIFLSRIWIPLLVVSISLIGYVGMICGAHTYCVAEPLVRLVPGMLFKTLFFMFSFSIPAFFLVLLIKPSNFHIWTKFTLLWFAISLLLVWIFPEDIHSWMPIYGILSKENAAMVLGALYSISGIVVTILNFVLPSRKVRS